MTVRIRFFAVLREVLGDTCEIPVAEEARCSDAIEELSRRFPHLAGIFASSLTAVDGNFVEAGTRLCGGELCVLPPVSGG